MLSHTSRYKCMPLPPLLNAFADILLANSMSALPLAHRVALWHSKSCCVHGNVQFGYCSNISSSCRSDWLLFDCLPTHTHSQSWNPTIYLFIYHTNTKSDFFACKGSWEQLWWSVWHPNSGVFEKRRVLNCQRTIYRTKSAEQSETLTPGWTFQAPLRGNFDMFQQTCQMGICETNIGF